ncbi:hypothetical protein MRS44_003302 [Fusarium solani]|uniref:uncharacterized protein n=1 Tax=Fusarium solani TaxID=169388 RepID=UPI0032C3EF79|nr:hypothetical protein MRS44_003302 [Fusarium solani]
MTASRSTGQRQRLSCSRYTELVVGQCSEGSTVKKSDSASVSQQPAQTGSWIQSVNGRSAGAGRSPCVSTRHRTGQDRTGQEAKSQRWYLKDVVTDPPEAPGSRGTLSWGILETRWDGTTKDLVLGPGVDVRGEDVEVLLAPETCANSRTETTFSTACLLADEGLGRCPLSRAAQGLQYVLVLRAYSVSQWQDRHLLHQADTQGSSECLVPSVVDVQITSTAWTDGLDAIDRVGQTRKGCASDMRCAYGVAAAIGGPHSDEKWVPGVGTLQYDQVQVPGTGTYRSSLFPARALRPCRLFTARRAAAVSSLNLTTTAWRISVFFPITISVLSRCFSLFLCLFIFLSSPPFLIAITVTLRHFGFLSPPVCTPRVSRLQLNCRAPFSPKSAVALSEHHNTFLDAFDLSPFPVLLALVSASLQISSLQTLPPAHLHLPRHLPLLFPDPRDDLQRKEPYLASRASEPSPRERIP